MVTIAIVDVAKQLPTILQALTSGAEFVVTDAGRPVARILPALPSEIEPVLSKDEWKRNLALWMNSVEARSDRYPSGFVVDDSYEAIYGERENAQR